MVIQLISYYFVEEHDSGLQHITQLQLSFKTVPANLGSLASGWLLEHGNSLFPAGMSTRKTHREIWLRW